MLSEALDYKPDDIPDHPLYQPLKEGQYDPVLSEEKLGWVKQHHQKMIAAKEKNRKDRLKSFEALLVPSRLRKS